MVRLPESSDGQTRSRRPWGAPIRHAHFVARELQAKTEQFWFRRNQRQNTVWFRRDYRCARHPVCMASVVVLCRDPGQLLLEGRSNWLVRNDSRLPTMRTCGTAQELLDIEGDSESSAVVESASGTWYWASFIGALFRGRFPEDSSFQAAAMCRERLLDVGFDASEWGDVAPAESLWPALTSRGHISTVPCGLSSHQQDRALLRSKCGPFVGIPFTCSPMVVESRLEPQIFSLWCPFRSLLTPGGAAVPLTIVATTGSLWAGVLASRVPFGERSSRHLPRGKRGFSQCACESLISTPFRQEGSTTRNIEVVAVGSPLFHGAQLAVHVASVLTTMEQLSSKRDTRRSPLIRVGPPTVQGHVHTSLISKSRF